MLAPQTCIRFVDVRRPKLLLLTDKADGFYLRDVKTRSVYLKCFNYKNILNPSAWDLNAEL